LTGQDRKRHERTRGEKGAQIGEMEKWVKGVWGGTKRVKERDRGRDRLRIAMTELIQ
jgi:hypothetical protein